MRILLTSPTYPPFNSGLGNAVARQAVLLTRAGHDVTVATGGAKRSTREESGVRVEAFAVRGADSWIQPIRGEVVTYTDFLRNHSWDVVLLNAWQNWATDLALVHLNEISGRRFVYSHCISTNIFFLHQPLRSLLRYLAWRPYWRRLPQRMRTLDGVLFLYGEGFDSRFDDLRLAQRLGVPIKIVPNCLSPAAMATLERPPQPMHMRNRLIAVGSYQWQKGFDFVIRAYAASRARYNLPLHLYGQEYSPYCASLRALAQRLGLTEQQVIFHEGVSGELLIAAYQQARLVLSGSHTECQPLALLDANAVGAPFVARNTGCIAAMPGGVGVGSWREMGRQIDLLLGEDATWLAIAEAGHRAARSIYLPELISRQLIESLS